MSGHRFKKVARRLMKTWSVRYTQALQCCVDTHDRADFADRLDAARLQYPEEKFADILFELCLEDWEFSDV